SSSSQPGIGPLGVVLTSTGGVLVSDATGDVLLFPTDSDNQTLPPVNRITGYGVGNAQGLARLGNANYLAQDTNGAIVQLNPDGTLLKTVVTGIPGATGLVADPLSGHLFVSTATQNEIFEVDPQAGTKTLFAISANPDGLALSGDGRTLYV